MSQTSRNSQSRGKPGNRQAGTLPQNKQKRNNSRPPRNHLPGAGPMASAPVAQARVRRTVEPKMRSLPNGDCIIVHREYLQDIIAAGGTAPTPFNIQQLPINPGLVGSFPWLAQVAQRFEKYQFKKLHYLYETESPSSLGGTLVLAVDYDASDPLPVSKQQALEYKNSVRSAPWTPCKHVSASLDLSQQKQYFVRAGVVPQGADIKLYDTGQLFIISQNVTVVGSIIGELYVEYEVCLKTPVFDNVSNDSSIIQSLVATSAANVFGTAPMIAGNLISAASPTGSLNFVFFQGLKVGQEYSFMFSETGTGITLCQFDAPSGIVQKLSLISQISTTQATIQTTFMATQSSGSIHVTTTATAITGSNLLLSQVPSTIVSY